MLKNYRVLLLLGVALAFCSGVYAATIHVPADQPTIQTGINVAVNGDTVLVAAGTYVGDGNRDLDYGGRLIVLISEDGPEFTIIDCQAGSSNQHYGFYFQSEEDSTAVLDGFTITGAFDSRAAVRCSTSSPSVYSCIIRDNQCGGVYVSNNSNPRFKGCSITNNEGRGVWVRRSGGDTQYSSLALTGCTVSLNRGDGIRDESGRLVVSGCDINTNDSCGIRVDYPAQMISTRVDSSLVRNNGLTGIFIKRFMGGQFLIDNCTVVSNQDGILFYWDFPKSGSDLLSADSSYVLNTIVASNRSRGIVHLAPDFEYRLSCNDAYNNPDGDYVGMIYQAWDDYGNICADPLFCDAANGDYHISGTSPCAPANNSCSANMGSSPVGCTLPWECGDADGWQRVNIVDEIFILDYILDGAISRIWPPYYRNGASPSPLSSGNPDGLCGISVNDVVYLNNYIFNYGPAPTDCPQPVGCTLTPSDRDTVVIGLADYHCYTGGDSIGIPVFLSNSDTVSAFSLGFACPSDSFTISSASWVGSIVPQTGYWSSGFSIRALHNQGLVAAIGTGPISEGRGIIPPQSGGLLFTINLRLKAAHVTSDLALDTSWVGPSGEFMLVGNRKNASECFAVRPAVTSILFKCGDANSDAAVDISDVVYLIAYIFSGGSAPSPLLAGDANCDSAVDISDVVYLIAYIFSGGAAPCASC
jgi:parallel beta-helix repeat protein